MTFGYLNLGNPKLIGANEAQEIKNATIENGYLEYATYETNELNNAKLTLPNGKITSINGPTVNAGQVKWKDTEAGTTLYAIGLDKPSAIVVDASDPTTTIDKSPTIGTASYGSNPCAAGTYSYGVTLYDPDTGEESTVTEYEITTADHATAPGSEIAEFTLFPEVATYFPDRPNLQWRIYRRPVGGTEYLLVNSTTVISANTAYAGPYQDIIEDQNLGISNDSYYDLPILRWTDDVNAIAMFNDHLFVGGVSASTGVYRIYFSRQGKWWAFPPENELNIKADKVSSYFKGFCNLGETLLMFGGNTAWVLYGDSADTFSLREMDFQLSNTGENNWFSQNTMRETNNMAVFSVDGYENVDIDGTSTQIVACKRLAAFDGSKAKVISSKIKPIFPLDNEDSYAETSVIDNRFYTIKYIDLDATLEALTEAGRDISSATTDDYVYITIVLDSFTLGWMTADATGAFVYRTKEFSLPRQVEFHKRIWVQAEGDFVLEFLGDGNVVSSITISLAEKEQLYLNVRPYRYQAFSFRFTGQPNCKIYDFGVDE